MSTNNNQSHGQRVQLAILGGVFVLIAAIVGIVKININLAPQNASTPTPTQVVPVFTPPSPTNIDPNGVPSNILGEALGVGNWGCLDGHPNGVIIKNTLQILSLPTRFLKYTNKKENIQLVNRFLVAGLLLAGYKTTCSIINVPQL